MVEKYSELIEPISESEEIGSSVYYGVKLALAWLDDHPDKAPGRTIPESTERDLYHAAQHGPHQFRDALNDHRITVAPDPEPTNAEKLEQLHQNWSQSDRNPPFGEWADSVGIQPPEDWGDDD